MPDDNARWNLVVSHETDTALRQFLASQGGGHKGDLSRFVEQAVRDRIFEETVRDIRAQNADLSPEYIEEIVDEAVEWARNK
jgi:hypothetical protein